jgi:tetratricopeptide (TPR) repeat protein
MIVAAALVLSLLAQTAPGDATDVETELRRAKNLYAYGEYKKAAEALSNLLYPMRLSNDEQVIETRKYLALSFSLLGREDEAKREFGKLLYLSPDYQLDPYTVPPSIVELLESVRKAKKPELDAIRQRDSDERLQSPTRRGYVRVVEQTVVERSSIGTLLPFGVGQYQNGDYGWAAFFAGTELALLAVNIASYLVATSYGPTYADASRTRKIDALNIAQYGALAMFGVTWSIGVYHARASFQPVVVGPRVVHDEPSEPVVPGGLMKLRIDF